MHKKLITACLAVVAFAAFALPAAAQAANTPVITHPTGTILGTGKLITGTNIGETTMVSTTGAGQLHCTVATMTGELTTNTTGNVQGNISAASFTGTGPGGRCTGFVNATVDPLGLGTGAGQGWCLKSTSAMNEDEFQVLGGKCSEAAKKIKFKLTPETGGECEYESTSTIAAKGRYTTDTTGDAQLSVPYTAGKETSESGFTKIKDTTLFALCPSSSALRMTFTLETDTPTAEPLYISS